MSCITKLFQWEHYLSTRMEAVMTWQKEPVVRGVALGRETTFVERKWLGRDLRYAVPESAHRVCTRLQRPGFRKRSIIQSVLCTREREWRGLPLPLVTLERSPLSLMNCLSAFPIENLKLDTVNSDPLMIDDRIKRKNRQNTSLSFFRWRSLRGPPQQSRFPLFGTN